MEYNPYSLKGKRILITGASSGIGRALAIECSKMGAELIITGRNENRLRETIDLLREGNHQYRICNLENTGELIELVDSISNIQGLVNNAGFTKLSPLQFISKEDINNIFEINTIAPILLLKYLLKKKKILSGSSVVFTSSLAGLGYSTIANSMYAASKGAICSFVACAALELSSKNIRVNSICPGMVKTNIIDKNAFSDEQIKKDQEKYPLGRYGTPEEIAWAIIYLLSDASSWTTGTNLVIDGGYSIR